jgi:transglutaminase-like putative cysteine protease
VKGAVQVLAVVVALAAAACDGGGGGTGVRPNGAAAAVETDLKRPSDPSWVTSFVDPGAGFAEQTPRDLFEVEAEHPAYWRMFVLDRYDGESWSSTTLYGSGEGIPMSTPATLPRSADGPPSGADTLNQTVRILSDFDSAQALPMALTAEVIAGPIGDITWYPEQSQAFIEGGLEDGMTYTVRSRIVLPTPQQLDLVDHPHPRTYRQWTELPADLDPRIGEMAERWTAGATSDYRRVLAIQQRFQNGRFVYSTDVEPADDGDALLEFLTQTRSGFCAHYSSAMAVMVRWLGLPARIAVGFRSGTRQADGSYLVRNTDAHVWVEVLFPGYGWLEFEPEAGTTHPNAQAGTYLEPGLSSRRVPAARPG